MPNAFVTNPRQTVISVTSQPATRRLWPVRVVLVLRLGLVGLFSDGG